ncbi:MAG: short-chain fatty acid transporter [Flavobacteriales bacterium]|nr:short-chain fatty acid transporter [Flavobacteriales bacterium]MBH70555.1 short-chain fatty acid transporter [Flavobacteriales bacterium]MBO97273.1 short-chain fatty acid transporter [Flavobacteriales bacterium]|tara:strand:- start:8200 stop:9549 length:1350 start_codon:yes stop_codon:yes gene_type:complete
MLLHKYIEKFFKFIIPSPFTIAVILTFFTFILAILVSKESTCYQNKFIKILNFWESGLWNPDLLVFTIQMMLMLVLGYSLALSKPINKIINKIIKYCNSSANAAAIITLCTIIVSFLNWGLGLIFGAIFSRKVGEYASKKNIKMNYPLIGAAGYSGLMVWHGGISGSAPIKIAEDGHFLVKEMGVISLQETVFSSMNLYVSLFLIIVLPLIMYSLGRKSPGKIIHLKTNININNESEIKGAECLDHSSILAYCFSTIILFLCVYNAFIIPEKISLKIITPNFINLCLLGIAILIHGNFYNFMNSIKKAINSTSGILIQFPLYFGIMGIMYNTGLVKIMSDFFVSISTETTFPIFTFISAGIVNIFVPSGGGQWVIQGPIIIDAANQLGINIPKCIMALAYGDQITNMLQPFWALPLLGITGLKAKEILPFTLILLLAGSTIFIIGILLF